MTMNEKGFMLEIISNYIKQLQYDDIIYPHIIQAKFHIEIKQIYSILELLVSKRILERNFRTYCKICNKFNEKIFRTPSSFRACNCVFCKKELSFLDDTIVIYRVIKSKNFKKHLHYI